MNLHRSWVCFVLFLNPFAFPNAESTSVSEIDNLTTIICDEIKDVATSICLDSSLGWRGLSVTQKQMLTSCKNMDKVYSSNKVLFDSCASQCHDNLNEIRCIEISQFADGKMIYLNGKFFKLVTTDSTHVILRIDGLMME